MFLKEMFAGTFPLLYFRSPLQLGFEYNVLVCDTDDVHEFALVINGSLRDPKPSLFFEGVELTPDFIDEDDLGLSFRYEKAGLSLILYVYHTGNGVVELTVW